jgi:hypothetical protein
MVAMLEPQLKRKLELKQRPQQEKNHPQEVPVVAVKR